MRTTPPTRATGFSTVVATLVACAAGLSAVADGGANRDPTTWARIRASLARTICVVSVDLPGGREGVSYVSGRRAECAKPARADAEVDAALDAAVDDALTAALPLIGGLGPGHVDYAADPDASIDPRSEALQTAFLTHDAFLRPVLRQLPAALEARGLPPCPDCPAIGDAPLRQVDWPTFRPYLTAYAWPADVRTPRDADGRAIGEPQHALYLCVGINGLLGRDDVDPFLAHAAFVLASATPSFAEIAGHHFRALLDSPEFAALDDDDIRRTSFLRRRLPQRLAEDDALRELACDRLRALLPELGLQLDGCFAVTGVP